jgi:DNA-binding IclR family transcriptional regulator
MAKPEDQILQLLKNEDALTLTEIAEKLDKKPKMVFKLLRKLFESNEINCDPKTRHYTLSKKDEN